jgi:MFS family permease
MTDSNAPPSAPGAIAQDWRGGWPVVAAGACGYMLISLGMLSMGAFMGPVQAAFHWSRSQFSLGLSVYAVVGVVLAPLVGLLIDWRGPRIVGVVGSLLAGLTFALFATANESITWWLVLWVIFASACQLIMPTLWSAAIASVFTVSLGLAIAVANAGSGVAAFLFPFVANVLIENFDFRTAYLVMGLGFGIPVALISALAMPAPIRRPKPTDSQAAAAILPGVTLSQGLRSAIFYKLAFAILVTNVVNMALTVHLIPLLNGSGLTRDAAVWAAVVFGVASMIGKILGGVALDRYSGKLVGALIILILVVAAAMLAVPVMSLAWANASALLFGLGYGSLAPVYPYLASRYFGRRAFGRLFGIMSSCYTFALATGPWLAGRVHDVTHSYLLFLAGGIPALLLCALLLASLGRFPDFAAPAAEPGKA